jgi:hypothetical protein
VYINLYVNKTKYSALFEANIIKKSLGVVEKRKAKKNSIKCALYTFQSQFGPVNT